MKLEDTSKDNGARGDGIPCGGHWGYSYNCSDCKHYPDADPDDIEDYRNYYPDPDKLPWTEQDLKELKELREYRQTHPIVYDSEGWPI